MSTNNWQNDTLSSMMFNETSVIPHAMINIAQKRYVTFASQLVLTFVYITGVIGNISALVILFHRDKGRNRKHLLMLRCLATNDLVALMGMLIQMYVSIYVDGVRSMKVFCSLRVVWRLFGLFSGCVAIVMAVERWLALTRPFVYQKVTYPVIMRCMLMLWLVALAITSLPVMGFGLYYKDEQCVRYREATESSDVAYAYMFFCVGTLLCLSIVWCNLAVSRALSRLGRRAGALRRISRASSKAKPLLTIAAPPNRPEIIATAEERAFARLMAVLSISFVICWMPHMISIPLAQFAMQLPQTASTARKCIRIFYIMADILLCIHFTLDPYIYVLLRMPRPRFRLLKPLCRICWPDRSRSNSFTESSRKPFYATGTMDHQFSSGDPPTPITEAPSTPVSEEHDSHLVTVSL